MSLLRERQLSRSDQLLHLRLGLPQERGERGAGNVLESGLAHPDPDARGALSTRPRRRAQRRRDQTRPGESHGSRRPAVPLVGRALDPV